ncbi:hypothetical protein I317_02230 [Kwoniella heveanensis CBS 569]|nr:hypothetical protein I317_02230 [Kwoniella heveanensis CBS 569]
MASHTGEHGHTFSSQMDATSLREKFDSQNTQQGKSRFLSDLQSATSILGSEFDAASFQFCRTLNGERNKWSEDGYGLSLTAEQKARCWENPSGPASQALDKIVGSEHFRNFVPPAESRTAISPEEFAQHCQEASELCQLARSSRGQDIVYSDTATGSGTGVSAAPSLRRNTTYYASRSEAGSRGKRNRQ